MRCPSKQSNRVGECCSGTLGHCCPCRCGVPRGGCAPLVIYPRLRHCDQLVSSSGDRAPGVISWDYMSASRLTWDSFRFQLGIAGTTGEFSVTVQISAPEYVPDIQRGGRSRGGVGGEQLAATGMSQASNVLPRLPAMQLRYMPAAAPGRSGPLSNSVPHACIRAYTYIYLRFFQGTTSPARSASRMRMPHMHRSHIDFLTRFTIRTSRTLAQLLFSFRCLRFLIERRYQFRAACHSDKNRMTCVSKRLRGDHGLKRLVRAGDGVVLTGINCVR